MKDEEGYLYDNSHVAPSKPHSPMAMGRAGGEGKVKIQEYNTCELIPASAACSGTFRLLLSRGLR